MTLEVKENIYSDFEKKNKSLPLLALNLLRWINILSDGYYNHFPFRPISLEKRFQIRNSLSSMNFLDFLDWDLKVKDQLPNYILDEISKSNRWLENRVNRNLSKIGYLI